MREHGNQLVSAHAPPEDHPSAARRELSALEGWILEVFYCEPKGRRAFWRILPKEGRGLVLGPWGLFGALFKFLGIFQGGPEGVFAYVGLIQNLKDLERD